MRHFLFAFLAITLVSCSKLSQAKLLGSWYVDSVETQEITSNTDTGWRPQQALSAIFFTGERLSFTKSGIIPCPSADDMLEAYDNYKGEVEYTVSGDILSISEIHYVKHKEYDNYIIEHSETTYHALTFKVRILDNRMELSGSSDEVDNLGYIKKTPEYAGSAQ